MSKIKTITVYSFEDIKAESYERDEVTDTQKKEVLALLDLGPDPHTKVSVYEIKDGQS